MLEAAPGMEFITSDQPAINTHGAFVPSKTPVEELELFYPVSPSRAVIMSGHAVYQDSHGKALDSFRMSYLPQPGHRARSLRAALRSFGRAPDVRGALFPITFAATDRLKPYWMGSTSLTSSKYISALSANSTTR